MHMSRFLAFFLLAIALLALLVGYLMDGTPVAVTWWARNIFLSALIASLVFLAESFDSAWKEMPGWAAITTLMIICWDPGPVLRDLIPSWFTNVWVQGVVGGVSAVCTLILIALIVRPKSEPEPGVGGD